jgi:hypothetical protein
MCLRGVAADARPAVGDRLNMVPLRTVARRRWRRRRPAAWRGSAHRRCSVVPQRPIRAAARRFGTIHAAWCRTWPGHGVLAPHTAAAAIADDRAGTSHHADAEVIDGIK